MRNVFRVFWRDLKRLAHVPPAWLVALFLIVLPSLYTWFNVYGFWNPYDNTGNLRVCVVNEDMGATDEKLGTLDLGSQVVEQLRGNDQMDWTFVDRQSAMDEVNAGTAYAAFVIPESFSADVAALASGDFEQSQIQYYVNEKVGPVAPKIMDKGATMLDATINGAFVSEVSAIVASAIDETVATAKVDGSEAKSKALARVDEADGALGKVRTSLASLSQAASDAQERSAQARESLEAQQDNIVSLDADLDAVATLLGTANLQVSDLALSLGSALDGSGQLLSQAVGQADAKAAQLAAKATAAKGDVDAASRQAEAVMREQEQAIQQMRAVEAGLPAGSAKEAAGRAIAKLESLDAETTSLLADLGTLSTDIEGAAGKASQAVSALDSATTDALGTADGYRASVRDDTLPAVGDGVSSLAATSSGLASAVSAQAVLVQEAQGLLAQLDGTLDQAVKAFGETDSLLADAQGELADVRADLSALSASDALSSVLGDDGVDAAKVAEFMLSPTKVETEELYPLNAYGSAMAPLFINLTLWIGVFMLMVIMRLEVDEEEVEDTTVSQRFAGRGMLLACMSALQAIVCCVGCLAIGVQAANVPLFILTAVIASLSYLAIQYSLSATFQHVGKAICVILVFVQIPGATGLYPIEMTPGFFRIIYPLFPFTYGINAIRETVFGLYGNLWAYNIAVLVGFMVAFTLVGVLVRPFAANLNRMFARSIEETDLVNIEEVHLPDRRYRLTQLISAFADREEFRQGMEERAVRFVRRYPRYKAAAAAAGIAAPLVATPIFMMVGIDKVIILTAWLLWLLGVMVFLVGVELIRDNMLHQMSLGGLSSSELHELYLQNVGNSPMRRMPRRRRARAGVSGNAPGDADADAREDAAGDAGHAGGDAG